MDETPQELTARHQDAFTIVRWLAFVLANSRVYGIDHKITRQSMDDATQALHIFLQRHGNLEFSVVGEDFQVDDEVLAPPISGTITLAKYLIGLRVNTLTVERDTANTEVRSFLKILFDEANAAQTEAGVSDRLGTSGLTRIRTTTFAYRRVKEDEAVVSQSEAASKSLDNSVAAAIRSLLDGGEADGEASQALRQADLDSEAALQEMVRIAVPPADVDDLGPAEVARQAVDRLERMSNGLLTAPKNRTQKGRKTIRKLIKSVESEVSGRLQRLGADIQAVEMLAARVKDLIEELAVDGLVAQYIKLRGEMADQENRLKRHIKRDARRGRDAGEMKSRLLGVGIPATLIDNLIAEARGAPSAFVGATPGATPATGAPEAAVKRPPPQAAAPEVETPLANLLKKLRDATPGDGQLQPLVVNILAAMNKTLQQTTIQAEAQMATLKRLVMIPAGRPDNADLSRRQLLVLMAELGQELRQPLTVVSGAVEMLLGGYFGVIANEQVPILEMVAESGRTLDDLIGRMIRIAGMPTSLNPDEAILARIK